MFSQFLLHNFSIFSKNSFQVKVINNSPKKCAPRNEAAPRAGEGPRRGALVRLFVPLWLHHLFLFSYNNHWSSKMVHSYRLWITGVGGQTGKWHFRLIFVFKFVHPHTFWNFEIACWDGGWSAGPIPRPRLRCRRLRSRPLRPRPCVYDRPTRLTATISTPRRLRCLWLLPRWAPINN